MGFHLRVHNENWKIPEGEGFRSKVVLLQKENSPAHKFVWLQWLSSQKNKEGDQPVKASHAQQLLQPQTWVHFWMPLIFHLKLIFLKCKISLHTQTYLCTCQVVHLWAGMELSWSAVRFEPGASLAVHPLWWPSSEDCHKYLQHTRVVIIKAVILVCCTANSVLENVTQHIKMDLLGQKFKIDFSAIS